ncbi:MAG: fibro-slime domain-containing protein [Phycisphaerales bacterium JB040]
MRRTATTMPRLGVYAAGLVCCLHGCMMSATVYGQDEIVLAGQIRDFQSTHPDFGLPPGSGGEVAGLLDFYLNNGMPVHVGNGLQLTTDALDGMSREIAPHMFADSPENTGVFVLKNPFDFSGNSTQDSYDPTEGYNPGTARPLPELETVSSIPNVSPPVFGVGVVKTAEMRYKKSGGYTTDTITAGDYHTDSFVVSNGMNLVIDGDVRIRVDTNFTVTQSSVLTIPDGSTLTFYIGGAFQFRNSSLGNIDNWDHSRLRFLNFGTEPMVFDNSAQMVATIVAPNSTVEISNSVEYFGAITADSVVQDNSSGIHIAGEFAWVGECFSGGDLQAAAGSAHTGDITSPLSFATWFRDSPGMNLTDLHQLVMSDIGGGVYSFKTDDWDPIEDALYGNESASGNRNFTVALQSIFLNTNCSSAFFEIATSMDAWVFVDDTMVIDLGGSTDTNRQRIDLDRLGLVSDRWYTVRVFLAHRVDGPQDLEISTTIPLTPPRDIRFRADAHHD